MRIDEVAQALLTAATSAGVDAPRKFVAPGPTFARDCRLIAVALISPSVRPIMSNANAGSCAMVPQHSFEVVFADDCVPSQDDNGSPPSPSAVTAWSLKFLRDCDAIFGALLGAAESGSIAGGCHNVSIGQGTMRGPQGKMASMIVPVVVMTLDTEF